MTAGFPKMTDGRKGERKGERGRHREKKRERGGQGIETNHECLCGIVELLDPVLRFHRAINSLFYLIYFAKVFEKYTLCKYLSHTEIPIVEGMCLFIKVKKSPIV
jgi:hypothetical protein